MDFKTLTGMFGSAIRRASSLAERVTTRGVSSISRPLGTARPRQNRGTSFSVRRDSQVVSVDGRRMKPATTATGTSQRQRTANAETDDAVDLAVSKVSWISAFFTLAYTIFFFALFKLVPWLIKGLNRATGVVESWGKQFEDRCARWRRKLEDGQRYKLAGLFDFFTFLLTAIFSFFLATLQWMLQILVGILSSKVILLILFICMIGFGAAEHKYANIISFFHSLTVGFQVATNTMFGIANKAIEVKNIVSPYFNTMVVDGYENARILVNQFADEDWRATDSAGGGRRLEEATLSFDTKELERQATEIMKPIVYGQVRIDELYRILFEFILALIAPYFVPITQILGILLPKIGCMGIGGGVCILREIFQVLVQGIADGFIALFNAIPLIPDIPPVIIDIGCTADDLPNVSPERCGGPMWTIDPVGAFYSKLKNTVTNLRRSLSTLACEPSLHDTNIFVETLDGKLIHKGGGGEGGDACPHTTRAITSTYDNLVFMNHFNIQEDCYIVCLHNVKMQRCFHDVGNDTNHFLGMCNEESATLEHGRRRLANFFNVFSPNKPLPLTIHSSGSMIHNEQPSPQSSSHALPRDLRSERTVTKEQLREHMEKQPRVFSIFNDAIKCDLTTSSTTPESTAIDTLCTLARFWDGASLKALGDGSFDFFFGGQKHRRSLSAMENEEVNKRYTRNIHTITDRVVSVLSKTRRELQLFELLPKNESFPVRVKALMSDLTHPQKRLVKQTAEAITQFFDTSDLDSRRRLVEEMTIAQCNKPGERMCWNGDCVKEEERDLCPPTDETASFWDKANEAVLGASLTDIDIPGVFKENVVDCYAGIRQYPDTSPFEYSNLYNGGKDARYCLGMTPPTTYRLPKVQATGIYGYITDSCIVRNSTGEYNDECVCFWYHQTRVDYYVFVFDFVRMDIIAKILNALMEIQFFFYVVLFIRFPFSWVSDAWVTLWSTLGRGALPDWFVFALSHLGLPYVPIEQRFLCFGLYLGSLFWVLFYSTISYIILASFGVYVDWLEKILASGKDVAKRVKYRRRRSKSKSSHEKDG